MASGRNRAGPGSGPPAPAARAFAQDVRRAITALPRAAGAGRLRRHRPLVATPSVTPPRRATASPVAQNPTRLALRPPALVLTRRPPSSADHMRTHSRVPADGRSLESCAVRAMGAVSPAVVSQGTPGSHPVPARCRLSRAAAPLPAASRAPGRPGRAPAEPPPAPRAGKPGMQAARTVPNGADAASQRRPAPPTMTSRDAPPRLVPQTARPPIERVRALPDPAAAATPPRHLRAAGPTAAHRTATVSPATRFHTAVTHRQLDRPRPLPASLHPLAAAITRQPERVRMTSGAATRGALRAAGAQAATTGTTVHLPRPPIPTRPGDLGVLAHELSHVAEQAGTPRFLRDGSAGHDQGERRASRLGRAVQTAASHTGSREPRVAPVDVARLPVAGPAGLAQVLRAAVGNPAASRPTRRGASEHAGLTEVLHRARAAGSGAPLAAGSHVAAPAAPVAGVGADGPGSMPGQSQQAAGTASQPAATPRQAPSEAPATASDAARFEDLLEALEERVLADLERRGGRYAGVF